MERETLCEPDLTELCDLELDIDLLPLYDFTEFPNLSWSVFVRFRPVAIVRNREAEDQCDVIPFSQAELGQRLDISASINDVNPTTSCSDLFEFSQKPTYGFLLLFSTHLSGTPQCLFTSYIRNIPYDIFVKLYLSINML